MPSSQWACEVYTAPAYTSFIPDNSRQNISFTSVITNNLGVNLSFSIKKWHIQSGLSYNFLGEKLEYIEKYKNFDTLKHYDVYAIEGKYRTDTIDSYYVATRTDTIWHYVTNSIYIPKYDSTLVTKVDTTIKFSKKKSINKYYYWEIPVLLGYSFSYKKLSINTKVGIIFGFFSNAKFTSSNNSESVVTIPKTDFVNTAYSLYTSVSINYKFNKRFYLIFEPNYRWNINSISSDTSPFTQRYNSYSFKIGLGIEL